MNLSTAVLELARGGLAVLVCRYRAVVAGRLHLIDAAGGALLVVASVAALHVAIVGDWTPRS